jgi:hypothetical protein
MAGESKATIHDGPLSPVDLRRTIEWRFDDEELRTLCFDVGVDYDSLRGEGKAAKARELVAWAGRTGRLAELEATVRLMLSTASSYERMQDWRSFYEQRIPRGRGIRTPSVRVALGCLIAVVIIVIFVALWGDLLLPMLIPVRTPTVTPTVSIETATPMPTTTPLVYPAPTLIGVDILACNVVLKWNWAWGLGEDEWFAVRVAKVPDVPYSIVWTKENEFVWGPEEAGEYTWEVAVCRGDPADATCERLAVSERGNFTVARCRPEPPSP